MLEKKFGLYLKTKGVSPITQKNYLSDLRHFLGWFFLVLKSKKIVVDQSDPSSFCSYITKEVTSRYKNFLSVNRIPPKTINRRLSTLRKFCSFCIAQGYLQENPAKHITNVGKKKDPVEEILKKFNKALEEEGTTNVTIKNYLSDIKQFLIWVEGVN